MYKNSAATFPTIQTAGTNPTKKHQQEETLTNQADRYLSDCSEEKLRAEVTQESGKWAKSDFAAVPETAEVYLGDKE